MCLAPPFPFLSLETLGSAMIGDRAAEGVGPYRENDMCGREM